MICIILIPAVYQDMKYKKVNNKLIVIGWIFCFIYIIISGKNVKDIIYACINSGLNIIIILIIGIILYKRLHIGAADFKIISVIAGFHDLKTSFIVFITMLVFCAAFGMIIVIIRFIKRIRLGEKGKGLTYIILTPFIMLAYIIVSFMSII